MVSSLVERTDNLSIEETPLSNEFVFGMRRENSERSFVDWLSRRVESLDQNSPPTTMKS